MGIFGFGFCSTIPGPKSAARLTAAFVLLTIQFMQMDKFFKNIDKQIAFNQGKNIFFDQEAKALKFLAGTINAIDDITDIGKEYENILINYTTEKVLEEFCRVNQYFTFNHQAKDDLRKIYRDLFSDLRDRKESKEKISKMHYQNLKKWLVKTNPFAEKIYPNEDEIVEPVYCAQYSPGLQIDILQVDIDRLMEPVLDIGCGKNGNLVNYLCENGIEAYGIDRFSFTVPNLFSSDWLEYNYGIEKWGSVISNLGFSNHFRHHHLREDGNYLEYGKTYMKILNSLKTGGCFHYSPDLPFIEQYLGNDQFDLLKYGNGEYGFKTSVIRRLK